MKKILSLALLFVAAEAVAVNAQFGPLYVDVIETGWGGEGIYISVSNMTSLQVSQSGCNGNAFKMLPNNPLFKENLTLLVTAQTTQKPVWFYFEGCESGTTLMNLKAIRLSK